MPPNPPDEDEDDDSDDELSELAKRPGEKIAKLGIKRDPDMMYYIRAGDVWATPRKKPGEPKGKAVKIAAAGIELDYSKYLYYLDGDGDIARKQRLVGGTPRVRAGTVDADEVLDHDARERREPFPNVACSLSREVHPSERCLRVDDYARALAAVLGASFGEFCFAVFGHWGRGKTFLMQRVAAMLSPTYRAIWFSAWKYRTTPETWIYLYETFVRAVRKDGVLSSTPRAIRAHISKHGMWPIFTLLGTLAIAILGLGLVTVLVGVLGVIGVLKAYAISRWAKKVPPKLLSLPQHADKLGLQAAIGDDLTALVKGWIPDAKYSRTEDAPAVLPRWSWLLLYFAAVIGIAYALNHVLQGREYGLVPFHPSSDVRWAIVATSVALAAALPCWVVYGGRGTQRVALIVDDLDRCDPSTMLDIIESLKLLLEDPEISARVQVVMLIEEEALHHAIAKRYSHIKDTRQRSQDSSAPPRAVIETVEKLFLAHLRLPELDRDDLTVLMRTYLEQYSLRPAGVAAQAPGDQPAVTLADPGDQHTNTAVTAETALVFTSDEKAALVGAIDELVDHAHGRYVGPRTIRAFLTRYQLAKFLLATRKAGCSPQVLVDRLVDPDPADTGKFAYPDLDAVAAEVC